MWQCSKVAQNSAENGRKLFLKQRPGFHFYKMTVLEIANVSTVHDETTNEI